MIWEFGEGAQRTWMFGNDYFTKEELRKDEVNMTLGNGYMCVRSCEDEYIPEQSDRLMLIAGMYNLHEQETTWIQNAPDFTNTVFSADGEEVRPMPVSAGEHTDKYEQFCKCFDMRDGLLQRSFVYHTESGKTLSFHFERIVSLERMHVMAVRCTVKTDRDVQLKIRSGIINTEPDCFVEKTARSAQSSVGYTCVTDESGITFSLATDARCTLGTRELRRIGVSEEQDAIFEDFSFTLSPDETLVFEKICAVHTSRDLENESLSTEQIVAKTVAQAEGAPGFETLYRESADAWKRLWQEKDIIVDTDWEFERQAIRYAIYNLTITVPRHDARMNIGARGLQGHGYNNHVFWDTEVYMLPHFIFTEPQAARKLLQYRYFGLAGARQKAKDCGYTGAMYPWEAAWMTDVECCPAFAETGRYEHHITGDVVQAIFYYTAATGDRTFLEKYGYEIIFSTAKYWTSRVHYNEALDRYEILDTIGPDENREHIDNNAFTNYIAYLNLDYAVRCYDALAQQNPDRLNELLARSEAQGMRAEFEKVRDKLYLPRENEDGIVPQDDTYLADAAKIIERRKTEPGLGLSKQADVMVLFLLFEDLFSKEVKVKNYHYYEPLCKHTSSLSRSSYAILSADVGEKDCAYKLYLEALQEDLGAGRESWEGIHTAAAGGLWQCAVLGFMGVRLYGTQLRIQPNLPDKWRSAKTKIFFGGQKMELEVDHERLRVTRLKGDGVIRFLCNGTTYTVDDTLTITY